MSQVNEPDPNTSTLEDAFRTLTSGFLHAITAPFIILYNLARDRYQKYQNRTK